MASVSNDPNGRKRIQFVNPDGDRKTIRLGKISKADANTIKYRVEGLLNARIMGAMDRDLAFWVADVNPTLREKLERVELLDPIDAPEPEPSVSLDAFLTDFILRNAPGKKPATKIVWEQVMRLLREYMPTDIALDAVTTGHAKQFAKQLKERGLASTTIHKRIGFARQFFEDAVDWELIDRNPFAKVKTQGTSAKANVEVSREVIAMVLKQCDTTWGTIVALSRFAGLRTPSETLSLKWGDIDWELDRMRVPECKVEHHEGRGVREVPIFPELRPHLEAAFDAASKGGGYPSPDSYVVDKQAYRDAAMRPGGWANANLRTQFLKILKRAKVEPWKRLFHSMRASRQTELEREFPTHVVCAWLGNSVAVAKKSYLLVTQEDFSKAAQNAAQLDPKVAQNAAQQVLAKSTQGAKKNPQSTEETSVFPMLCGSSKVEDNGLEPMTSCMPCRRSPN